MWRDLPGWGKYIGVYTKNDEQNFQSTMVDTASGSSESLGGLQAFADKRNDRFKNVYFFLQINYLLMNLFNILYAEVKVCLGF